MGFRSVIILSFQRCASEERFLTSVIQTVVYFTDTKGFGGAEQMVLTLLACLDRRLWRPVLMYHSNPGVVPLLERARKLEVKIIPVPEIELKSKQGIGQMLHFVRLLRREHPAVFHAHLCWWLHCTYGILGAVLARIPAIVATQHSFHTMPSRRMILRQKAVSLAIDRYIAVSHDMARCLRQSLWFPASKVEVVHNGIRMEPFLASNYAAGHLNPLPASKHPTILALARLTEKKGLRYLIEAAALVPEALFVLVGDGPDRARLEAQAEALGVADRVSFLGQRDDIPDLLAECDLFVLPSTLEGFPISVLEAMAAGKPVIATAIGGTGEAVVHGETGLLVAPGDPPALAAAIRTLLANPTLARTLGAAGKARVQREFSAEIMVQRTTQIYEELLSSHGAALNEN